MPLNPIFTFIHDSYMTIALFLQCIKGVDSGQPSVCIVHTFCCYLMFVTDKVIAVGQFGLPHQC